MGELASPKDPQPITPRMGIRCPAQVYLYVHVMCVLFGVRFLGSFLSYTCCSMYVRISVWFCKAWYTILHQLSDPVAKAKCVLDPKTNIYRCTCI